MGNPRRLAWSFEGLILTAFMGPKRSIITCAERLSECNQEARRDHRKPGQEERLTVLLNVHGMRMVQYASVVIVRLIVSTIVPSSMVSFWRLVRVQ